MTKINSNVAGGSKVTVVIPALNEEKGIGSTILEVKKCLKDIQYIVVDGNSKDKTAEISKKMDAEVITQKSKGKGRAIAEALDHVNWSTRYIVFIDADFTYPAEYICRMTEILESNPLVGMVIGNRFNENFELKDMAHAYYFGNRFLAWMQYWFNGIKLTDPLTGLRVVQKKVLKDWKPKSKGFDIEVELNHYVKTRGYRIVEIPIRYRKRMGMKKLSLRHGFMILRRIIIQALTL